MLFIEPNVFANAYNRIHGKQYDSERFGNMGIFQNINARKNLLRRIFPLTYGLSTASNEEFFEDTEENSSNASSHIIEAFVSSLDSSRESPFYRNYCRNLGVQIHDIILANPRNSLSIEDFREQLGVSLSSLQHGFQYVYGTGIIEHHARYRLHCMRNHMLANEIESYEALIRMFGFNHLGRTAAIYKALFGVSPSQQKKYPPDNTVNFPGPTASPANRL